MLRDAFDLGDPLSTNLLQKRSERMIVQPSARFRCMRERREFCRSWRYHQVPQYVLISQLRLPDSVYLHDEHPFVNDAAESIDHSCPIEIQAHWRRHVQRVEARSIGEGRLGLRECVPAQCFEKRMAGGDPFEAVLIGGDRKSTRLNSSHP